MIKLWCAAFGCTLLFSCQNDDFTSIADDENKPYQLNIPDGFPELSYTFSRNPLTEKGVALGEMLFNDGRLSADNLVSCNFCHQQEYAFTHHGHDLSHGVFDRQSMRNAPAIQNMAWIREYFYDGASNNLEMASIVPIHNPDEMAETLPNIVNKLKTDAKYQKMFAQAFGDSEITSSRILKALAQYMTILVSANSKYDQWKKDAAKMLFTDEELYGYQIFQQKCASCHSGELFTDQNFRNNGLPLNPNLNDFGRELVSGDPMDRRKFKVPSLRNVAVTAPYMHDGRFNSLQSVLNFYTHGMEITPNIDAQLVQNGEAKIPLTQEEKLALISFFNTLTDEEFISTK